MKFLSIFKKKKNTAVVGTPQPPKHPSNDSTPVTSTTAIGRDNLYESYAFVKTCAFEGSGINQVTDNFDGQGISLGGLQWCIGQGSLQAKILKPYFRNHKPDNQVEMVLEQIATMDISKGMSLCKKHFLTGTKLRPEVRKELERFCIKAEKYQMLAAEEIFNRAWSMCKTSGLMSLKAFCFFFDVCVQNGSMNGIPKPKYDLKRYQDFIKAEGGINRQLWSQQVGIDQETVILTLWINDRAKKNKWRSDVISRKCTIAHGIGMVHGKLFTFPEFKQGVDILGASI